MADLKNEIFLSSLKKGDMIKFYLNRDTSKMYIGIVAGDRDEFGKLNIEMPPPIQNNLMNQEITIVSKLEEVKG